ncbi:MAG: amino acid ABC transporter ATP-binding protein, partial [Lachnospiraceae bacterium]|nr:amino acid ABC transporter ATP-binding protein [Lachnospiraceae bacterium]
ARTLAMRPDIIFLDEPTSALDPELVSEVLNIIKKVAGQGYTMLLVSHEMDFIRKISTRVIFLDGGKIIEDGTPAEVFERPKSQRARDFFDKMNILREPDYYL